MKMHETQGRKQDTHHIDTAAGFFGTCVDGARCRTLSAITAPYLLQVYSNVVVTRTVHLQRQ